METIYDDPELMRGLMVNGNPPPQEFSQPAGLEARLVCLPRGTGGSHCGATRTDWFRVGAPIHRIPRISYNLNLNENPGAWTLAVMPLSTADAQRVSQTALNDGTTPPLPTYCVVNSNRPPAEAAVRLYLPIPPYYPDEVRARIWARGSGYLMAPPTVCSISSSGLAASSGDGSSNASSGSSSGGGNPASSGTSHRINSPSSGQRVNGLVPIIGTAQFDPSQGQYYKLEIGSGSSPNSWTTFGITHSQPVNNGTLEQLHADALPPGNYVIRLVLVGRDGNFIGQPHHVSISIGQ